MTDLNEKARFNLQRASVLLAETESSSMEITAQILAGFGVKKPFRVQTQEDALKSAQVTHFDLIVCDGAVPDGGAYDFVAALRRSAVEPNRWCPVIIVAGHTPAGAVQKARDCGANFVIAKPLSPRILLERILWLAQEDRPFIELDFYVGPDRRFQKAGAGRKAGRRRTDPPADAPDAGNTEISA